MASQRSNIKWPQATDIIKYLVANPSISGVELAALAIHTTPDAIRAQMVAGEAAYLRNLKADADRIAQQLKAAEARKQQSAQPAKSA